MPEAEKKTTSRKAKEPVKDSEGLPVVTAPVEDAPEEPKKSASRKAYEDEIAKDAAEQEKANAEAWEKFINR